MKHIRSYRGLRVEQHRAPGGLRFIGVAFSQLVLLLIVLSAADRANSADRYAASKGDLQAKFEYCQDCHGPSGQGYRGFSPIPRLAGQQTEYFENQLTAFIEHRRTNKFMFKVAHSLSPAMLSALAAHFNELNPKPLGGAPKNLAPAGKEIFEEGIPDANIPACSVCHGPEAKGKGQIPRLAGQIYPYTIKVLTNWDKERGQDAANPDISAIMKPIAHNLNASQISAVAAYLSSLE